MDVKYAPTKDVLVRLLRIIGEDENREGLAQTPDRFAAALKEWFAGYSEPYFDLKAFTDGARGYNQMVVETGIPVWSHCEHHIAPFFGVAHIGYIPGNRIVGLSKLPRLVNHYARRLQVQERLTVQIADAMHRGLNPQGAGVVLQCRHTCMESRGVRLAGVTTTTSAMRGHFLTETATRAEFMGMIPTPGHGG